MKVTAFTATADLIGRRVLLRWTMEPLPGEAAPDRPVVRVRRKTRDFAFPADSARYLLYDDAEFPPPGAVEVVDLPDRDRREGPQRILEQTLTVLEDVGGIRQEVRRRIVRTVFGADRSVLRREVDLLDAGDLGGVLLEPGVPYYYQLDGPESLRATATAGEVHGNHRTLYELIPAIYRRHDTQTRPRDPGTGLLPEANAGGGQLRRFVDTFGVALDSILSSAEGLRGLRATAEVEHRFLPLLAAWIGWDLTADGDIARQRSEIATAPGLYGTVGAIPGLRSIVDHYTGWSTRVAEFAQHITCSNAAPQRNLFAAVQRGGAWWGAQDAAPVLGLTVPAAVGDDGVAAVLTGVVDGPFALRAGMTLTVAADGALAATIVFGPGDFADLTAASAGEVAAVLTRMLSGVDAEAVGAKLRLRSRLTGPESRLEVSPASASLVALDGAPRGRLTTCTDAAQRRWVGYATTCGHGGTRLLIKASVRAAWLDATAVPSAAPQADPALLALPGAAGLWLACVAHPDTGHSVLRWRTGRTQAMEPARLRGEVRGPFRLVEGTRLTLTGYGASEVFHVRAAAYAVLARATAQEVVAAFNAQVSGVVATVSADGGITLRTAATGPDVVLRVDLPASTCAHALGFGDRRMRGQGSVDPAVDWAPPATVPTVPIGWHADCTAATDPAGAIRLVWRTHTEQVWRLARVRWDATVLAGTTAGVGERAAGGAWQRVTTANGLPGNDIRALAVDADGSTWYATAAGAAVRRPGGTITQLTVPDPTGNPVTDLRAVALAPDGTVWFGHAAGVSARLPDGTWHTAGDGLANRNVRHLVIRAATDGVSVWAATASGLSRRRATDLASLESGWETLRIADGLPSNDIRHLAVDPYGAIWVATGSGAAWIGADDTVTTIDLAALGAPTAANDVRAVAPVPVEDVRMLAPVSAYGAQAFASGAVGGQAFAPMNVDNGRNFAPASAAEGGAVAPSGGDSRVLPPAGAVGGEAFARIGAEDGLTSAGARTYPAAEPIVADHGPVWLATGAGVVELRSDTEGHLYTTADGLPDQDCRAVLVTADGTVYVGTPAGLAIRDAAGWRTETTASGLVGNNVRALHGPWSAPLWFPDPGAGEYDPHLVRDGDRLWLAAAHADTHADPLDRHRIRMRRFDWPGPAWSAPIDLTTGTARDREPAIAARGTGGARVYFRSDRGGGEGLYSADLSLAGAITAPEPVLTGAAANTNPAVLDLSDGLPCLLFRSDRNVALGRLGGYGTPTPARRGSDIAGADWAAGLHGRADISGHWSAGAGESDRDRPGTGDPSHRAADEASVRRFAGSTTVALADLDRNRGRRQFGDLLAYTPQRPDGSALEPDELYTPGTLGLYVERGPAGRPLIARDADRLRELLIRFLPVNRRAVVVLRSSELDEEVFGAGHPLTEAFRDEYPFAEYLTVSDAGVDAIPDWRVFRATDLSSRTADRDLLTTLRNRVWWPPFPEESP
ncbi:two-component regulator propeller domain-containing protein [Nocardia sp. NPDC050712]|uniref:two-component regulator propeller domain-containing protein n=1 Tax=Nocardia sp. NPDC050712 TaxID=3155518 RepID=UPI0033D45AB2